MDTITTEQTARIIEETRALLTTRYVFPELGEQLAELIGKRAADGAYAGATGPAELGALVTADLQSANGDRHLRLKYHEEQIPDLPDEEATMAMIARDAERTMGGIARVERLAGGAALLEIAPLLFPCSMAGDAIAAAMTLLSRATALVIDLRGCVGGDPGMVALIASYLFDEDTHLNSIFERRAEDDRTNQSWTLPYVPGTKFGGTKPVYVLTSGRTFSGGEELAYDLQQAGRATLVGETTGGGAHPRIGIRVHAHLEATIPVARSIHPVTGTNWEGVGVIPDIQAPAGDALEVAVRAIADTAGR